MSETISYPRPDGKTCIGLLRRTGGRRRRARRRRHPGVVGRQRSDSRRRRSAERGGLPRDRARSLSRQDEPGRKEAEHLMSGLDFGDAATQDIRGAVQYLKKSERARSASPASAWAARSPCSRSITRPRPTPPWCGTACRRSTTWTRRRSTCRCRGTSPSRTRSFPIAQADALDEKLTAANVPHEFYRYHAQHAFANETAVNMPIAAQYDATAADTAWQRTMAFFKSAPVVGAALAAQGRLKRLKPALRTRPIRRSRHFAVRHRRHGGANARLHVRLGRRLAAGVFLAPDDRHFGAGLAERRRPRSRATASRAR